MYKLVVVAGPNRGSAFSVSDGETSIGRQSGNSVVLTSSRVSKRHCVLVVSNDTIELHDQGSANGTFVNGVMTKSKKIKPGDRISVGEFVLELAGAPAGAQRVQMDYGKVIPMRLPQQRPSGHSSFPSQVPGFPPAGAAAPAAEAGFDASGASQVPRDLKGKLVWFFDQRVMPVFHGMNLKSEWRMLSVAIFSVFLVVNLFLSISPLLSSSRGAIVKEATRRAQLMAKVIVERNSGALAARMETKAEIGAIEKEDGVRVAVLTDLDSRIIAPSAKLNNYLNSGEEARVAVNARDRFRRGLETGFALEVNESTVVAVEPVKVLSAQLGKNVVIGMAIVSIDSSLSTLQMGEMGMIYAETLVISGILGAILLLLLYKLTLKPFQVLNDDMDKVLKGEMAQVTHEFKVEEMNSLWDIINSALQRIPKGSGGESGMEASVGIEEFTGPLRALADAGKLGVLVFDSSRKIAALNGVFEEISGIRSDNAIGQELGAVARDQALPALCSDLLDRAQPGSEGVSEEFDFGGVPFKVHATAFGSSMARCYVILVAKNE